MQDYKMQEQSQNQSNMQGNGSLITLSPHNAALLIQIYVQNTNTKITQNANLKDTNTKLQNARTITKPKKYTQDNRSLRTLSPHTQHNELQCIYKYTNIRYTQKIATNQEQ